MKETKYTYFRIDFKDWGEEFDYTIVENIEDILEYIKLAEIHLDDPTRKTKVIITGAGMTKKQFAKWQEQNEAL